MRAPDPRELAERIAAGEPEPAWWTSVSSLLMARAMIAQYGIEGWMRLEGIDEPHPMLGEWLAVIESELATLRHARDVERVDKARKARAS